MERLILHGGLGDPEKNPERVRQIEETLCSAVRQTLPILQGAGAREAVLHAIRLLEDCPLFNAGTGSMLQADGRIRMSAAVMDGMNDRFSGVINVQMIQHPVDVAALLSERKHTVLAGAEATGFCRQVGIPEFDPETAERRKEFEMRMQGRHGTVGAVALDRTGRIVAGTSTGGIGAEIPGRVSDSATVAGTYASTRAGVSCTGVGEEIVNRAAASRVVVRVEGGMSLDEAVSMTLMEGGTRDYYFGLIALSSTGGVAAGTTNGVRAVFYACYDGAGVHSFLQGAGQYYPGPRVRFL